MTSTLLPSFPAVDDVLFNFAQSDGFWANLETAFGTSYDVVKATELRQQWKSRNFSQLPEIEVVNSSVLGSANGAYGISTNKIYLSESFFASASSDALVAVMLEEIGHFVDAQVNTVDTVGDEGELFSHLVRGVNLTEAELTYIQTEDDRSVIDLGGQFIGVEQTAPITLIVNTTIDENDGSATIGSGLSLRDAVAIANKSPNTPYIIKLKSGTTYALTYVNNTTTGDRSLRTQGSITIETDGTALASIVNNASYKPPIRWMDYNSIISNSSKLGVTLNNLYISSKGGGRGIYNSSNGILTLTNSTITGNTANVGGGGIYNDGTLTLTNSTISGNTATYGGGIWNRETLTLNNNTISGNTANYGGGIYNGLPHYYNGERGTLTLNNNTISGNTAIRSGVGSGVGGGIDNSYSGILTLNNNTISGNTATYGGGISNGGTLTLTNNIITNNNANLGGGIGNYGTWNSNSIISGNTANQVWYINPDGLSVVDEFTWIDYSNQKITNPIDPKYPNIFDQVTFTALPPTPNPPPKPTISVSNAWVDVPAGTNQTKVLKFEVKLSSAYDKPITVDYYTLDGSANSIDPNQLKDFNNVVKKTLSFFPGQTSKQIEITVLGSAPPTDQTFEIFAKDTAFRDIWKDTDKGKEVDKIYDYSDLGYEGYRINKVFKDSTTGFDAVGLTSDEKFFLVLANPLNANEFTSNSNNLLQDIANTSGGNNTAAYTAGQNLINQLTSANQSYTFTNGTIYDLAKPPVLAIRGGFSQGKDLLSDLNPKGIGYNQFTNNKDAINQWLSEVTNPVSGLTLRPNITGYSLGGALTQWVGGSYTGQLGKIVTFNSPGISQQPGINFNATNNLGVTHYITSADVVSMAGSSYLNGVWNLDKYSKPTSAITLEKHTVPVLNQAVTITNNIHTKPTDLTRKVANGNTTDLSSYWFTYLPDADYFALQAAVAAIRPILGAALTYRGTVELNRKAIGSAIDGLGTISDAVKSAYNAAKSWTSDAWDAIIGQSDKKLGLSPSTANQSNSTLKLASSFLDTNSYEIATTATASQTIDNFWDAIPDWGNNAWQATTKWSGDAWKSIDEWTPQTWQATTTWTAADWNKPFFTISNPTIVENNSGTNNLIFKVTLSTTSTQTITVNYATANNTATAGSDYTAKTGTLTFTPGQISQDIIISVNGDTAIEPDETFLINLSNPSNALITDNQGLGTITNDDGDNTSVTLAVSPASVTEDGTTNLVYTFTRSGSTTNALTVNYTLGGTATLNTDYTRTGTTNTVTFAANSSTATVTIDPTADTIVESNETVILTLAAGTGYTIGTPNAATGTINNDDFSQLSINDITVVEGKDNNAILTVTVDNPNPQPITFNYTTAPINATANVDYTSKTGTITIAPNTVTATISIPILNDNLNEPDEAFTVTLSNPVNATINPEGGIGEVIITDTWQSSLTRTLPNNVENLRLIGTNNINGTGNAGDNNITGNSGNNQINGGAGIDTLTGGNGADTFIFQFGQSTISTSDRITDFAINSDKIDLLTQGGTATSAPSNFSRAANSTVTTLQNLINQVFTDANGAITGNQGLGVNSAALVQVTTGAIAGTYLVINDSAAGFQSSNDLLINITGFTGTLPALGSIPVGNFFI